MIVCHCHRVCDRTVKLCVRNGARTADEVGSSCGAGTACGGCQPTIEEIVRECRGEDEPAASPRLLRASNA